MKINIHTSHPSAFISSTFIDLKDERRAVAEALKERGLNVNALDVKPASTNSSKNEILEGIRESDFIVLIIGDRYGSILPRMTGSDSLSITWWEYNNAYKLNRPVLAYFKSFNDKTNLYHDDKSQQEYEKDRRRFSHFKKIVTTRHNPQYFDNPYELSEKVQSSIISVYRNGLKEITKRNNELTLRLIEEQEKNSKFIQSSHPNSANALARIESLGNIERDRKPVNLLLQSLKDSKKP